MANIRIDETIELIQRLDSAKNSQELALRLIEATKNFGVERVFAGIIPISGAHSDQQKDNILINDWPLEWANRYFENGYFFKDPTIKRIEMDRSAFVWRDLYVERQLDSAQKQVMNEASDFRLVDGFTISMDTLDGSVVGLSFAGSKLDISKNSQSSIQMIATYAIARALMLKNLVSNPKVTLTARERSALMWAAEGKTRWEIGQLMGITEHGADKHLRSIRAKLGTTTTTYAIAEAFRLKLIA
jgi:LuxR family transcriptional regulator, quorum-sensing system regulator BjaR1